MKVYKIYSWIMLFGGMLTLFSCKKSFLDLQSKQSADANTAIVDIESMRASINGVYSLLQSISYYGRTYSLLPDLMSDNTYISTQNSGRYLDYDQYIPTSHSSYAEDTWNLLYRVIVNSNFIIQKGAELDVPDDDKEEQEAIIGEAYAIRALAHFDLCRLYAQPYNYTSDASHPGIPLVTHSSSSIENLIKPARNTVKEVYDTVIQDFKTAVDMLPTRIPGKSSSYKGMITKNAAWALLSRVYLYRGDWKNCDSAATRVIDSKQYGLLSGAALVNDFSKDNNKETIFEVVNSDVDNHGNDGLTYMYAQAGYGDILASLDLYNSYAAGDVRRNFMKIGDRNSNGGEEDVPLILKYGNSADLFAENIKIIRLAEVYLNRAEAKAHEGGHDAEAIADLEKIARRADPSASIDPNLSGQALIDRILTERRKELAFEGQRLFDLTRNKKDFTKYETGGDSMEITYPENKTILPIPISETDVNKNIDQNDGY